MLRATGIKEGIAYQRHISYWCYTPAIHSPSGLTMHERENWTRKAVLRRINLSRKYNTIGGNKSNFGISNTIAFVVTIDTNLFAGAAQPKTTHIFAILLKLHWAYKECEMQHKEIVHIEFPAARRGSIHTMLGMESFCNSVYEINASHNAHARKYARILLMQTLERAMRSRGKHWQIIPRWKDMIKEISSTKK